MMQNLVVCMFVIFIMLALPGIVEGAIKASQAGSAKRFGVIGASSNTSPTFEIISEQCMSSVPDFIVYLSYATYTNACVSFFWNRVICFHRYAAVYGSIFSEHLCRGQSQWKLLA